MTNDDGRKPEGAPERSPKAGVGGSGVDGNGPKRFSVQRKMAIVARLLAASRWNWCAGDDCLDRQVQRVARTALAGGLQP